MGFFRTAREWASNTLFNKAQEEFSIQTITSNDMASWVSECANIYRGNPCWLSVDDHIDTVSFAKAICSEVARLVTMEISFSLAGSARADWLQAQLEKVKSSLRHWVEYGCAYGTVILKPNGKTVDLYIPGQFIVTEAINGRIKGALFYHHMAETSGDRWYTRMEYHHFRNDGIYQIDNICYVGYSQGSTSRRIHISQTPWNDLEETVAISNITEPLFAVFRMPQANNIDINSPLGLPIFSEAVQELRDLDIAYSRNAKEIIDSKRTVLLDSDRLLPNAESLKNANALRSSAMPDYIKLVDGDTSTESDIYHEINPQLNTDTRLKGINALLSQIGYKVGFSNGYFVFNESSGIQTATQIEAEQQRTVQLIQDVREELKKTVKSLVSALDAFASLYSLAPNGAYSLESAIHFEDITYSFEADKAHHYQLALSGKYPWEEYYVRYLKCSREEARELLKMAKAEQKAPTLFSLDE